MDMLLARALAPKTQGIYRRAWDRLQDFQTRRGLPVGLPVASSTLALFVTSMDLAGYAAPTVATSLSAISFIHKLAGFPDPADTFLLRKLRDGIARNAPSREPRRAMTLELLNEMVAYLSQSRRADANLYSAIFSLAFHLCARIGELVVSNGSTHHALRVDQVSILKKNETPVSLQVTFRSYKHKQDKGQVVRLVSATKGQACPVGLLVRYLSGRRRCRQDDYLFVTPSGRPVQAQDVRILLRSTLTALGRDPTKYSTHSFRVGGATTAAQQGASDAQLRMLGRWSSSAFLSYVRPRAFSFNYKRPALQPPPPHLMQ